VKELPKGEKCMASTGWCSGLLDKAWQSMTFLRATFPGYLILRFYDILWPPHSPDLTASDLFLWEYLKYHKLKVYSTHPPSTRELKDHITGGIGTIDGALLQRIMQDIRQ
jgi:hypothetical protein